MYIVHLLMERNRLELKLDNHYFFSYYLPAPHILQKSTSPIAHSSLQQEQFCLAPDMKVDMIAAKDWKKTMDYIFFISITQYINTLATVFLSMVHTDIVG